MLDLDFSPEQELLRSTAVRCWPHCPLSVVRQMEDDSHRLPGRAVPAGASST